MNIKNAYPSKWLTSADIPEDADLALTIKAVSEEKVGQGEAAQSKPVIYFQEVEKGMVCNKTNATTIANLYGPETDNWPGQRIALFATEVDYQGKQTLAIRVRLKAPKSAPAETVHPPLAYKDALALYCSSTGYGEPEFKASLKGYASEHGYTGYSASRDTPFVHSLIDNQEVPI